MYTPAVIWFASRIRICDKGGTSRDSAHSSWLEISLLPLYREPSILSTYCFYLFIYLFIYLFNLIYIYGSPSGCIEPDFEGAVQNTKNIYIINNIVKLNNNSNKQSILTICIYIYIYIYITKLLLQTLINKKMHLLFYVRPYYVHLFLSRALNCPKDRLLSLRVLGKSFHLLAPE